MSLEKGLKGNTRTGDQLTSSGSGDRIVSAVLQVPVALGLPFMAKVSWQDYTGSSLAADLARIV